MSHCIKTDWRLPAIERHVFIGKYRQFSMTFHPEGFIECDTDGPTAPEEMSQILDWMGITIEEVRYFHDRSLL